MEVSVKIVSAKIVAEICDYVADDYFYKIPGSSGL
jgi:hypothetical protein